MQSRLVPEKCIACGLCQVYAPNIFDYDDHGIVLFKDEPHARQQFIPENERENVLKAYRKCPTRAIEISSPGVSGCFACLVEFCAFVGFTTTNVSACRKTVGVYRGRW